MKIKVHSLPLYKHFPKKHPSSEAKSTISGGSADI